MPMCNGGGMWRQCGDHYHGVAIIRLVYDPVEPEYWTPDSEWEPHHWQTLFAEEMLHDTQVSHRWSNHVHCIITHLPYKYDDQWEAANAGMEVSKAQATDLGFDTRYNLSMN